MYLQIANMGIPALSHGPVWSAIWHIALRCDLESTVIYTDFATVGLPQ
jgi:hypothetical protein